MSLIYNATFDSQTRILSLLDKAGNVISSCEVPSKSNVDDITKPLTFRAIQDGSTVTLASNGAPSGAFQTSSDGGKTWVDYTIHTTITLNTGDEVSFRAKSNRTSAQNVTNYFKFSMNGKIEAWHNAMSMYRTNDFATYNATVDYAFYAMFIRCTSLVKAPVLPATTLAEGCYWSMFTGCTSLAEAPALPTTTLAKDCYYRMFGDCASLVNAPVLPATTLASGCYNYMFNGCTSLAEAPALPATTLSARCYDYMFAGCTSLTKSPVLTATTLARGCYNSMFRSCSSLNEVRCHMPSSYSSSDVASYATDWLKDVSSTGTFYTNADAKWATNSASGIPTGWTRVNEGAPAVDDPNKPLMLRAIEDNSSVTLAKKGTLSNTYQTSTNGTDWTDYTLGTQISLNNEDVVYFRCSNHPTTQSYQNHVEFSMTGKIEAWHNAYSMISSSFTNTGASVGSYGMYALFKDCKSLTKAPLLVNTLAQQCYSDMFNGCTALTQSPELPAMTLAPYCYNGMFYGCTSLTQVPLLPATTLEDSCYSYMFYGCTALTQSPELPAMTLAQCCYEYMFYGCTALTRSPELPAMTLARRCYADMFYGCTALTQSPELPAMTLAQYCYQDMLRGCTGLVQAPELPATNIEAGCYFGLFSGCTGLTQAPELPAMTLRNDCYRDMFYGCSNLKEVRISATKTATYALGNWLSGVSPTGDFYCDPNATIFPTDSASGIPQNWTRHALSDYPATP